MPGTNQAFIIYFSEGNTSRLHWTEYSDQDDQVKQKPYDQDHIITETKGHADK